MIPADERLDPVQPVVLHADQRLVLQPELAPVDGRPERGGEGLAGHAVGVALRVEQRPAGLAVGLRPVQRRVRRLHQGGGRGAGRVPLHDTDRRRHRQPLAGDVEGGLDRPQHGFGQLGQLFGARGVLDEQRELVAAEPGHQRGAGAGETRLVRAAPQTLGDGGQQPVADAVAEGVVDGLEAVQIQVAQPDPARAALLVRLRLQRGRQAFEEQRAVGQPGHRVVHLQVPQPGLEFPAGADVRDGHEHAPVVGGQRGDRHLHPQRVPVGVLEAACAAQPGLPAAQHLAVGVPGAGVGGEVDQIGGDGPGEFVRGGAEQRGE